MTPVRGAACGQGLLTGADNRGRMGSVSQTSFRGRKKKHMVTHLVAAMADVVEAVTMASQQLIPQSAGGDDPSGRTAGRLSGSRPEN
jgi:hypothetical protein